MEDQRQRSIQAGGLTNRAEHCLQPVSRILFGGFRGQKPVTSHGTGSTARGQEQHIVLCQFLGHGHKATVLSHSHIVTAGQHAYPLDGAINDVVNQRLQWIFLVYLS